MRSMKKSIVASLMLFSLLALLLFPQASAVASPRTAPSAYDLIAAVNALRRNNGLPELTTNVALMFAAQGQSDYLMNTYGANFPSWDQGHIGAGGSRPPDRARAAGYQLPAGKNVIENWAGARSSTSLSDIIYNAWSDDAHWTTMTTGYGVDVGAGVTERDGIVYYILDVGVDYSIVPGSGSSGSSGTSVAAPTSNTTPQVAPVEIATPLPDGSIFHIVQKDQALWSIAIAYGITIEELRQLNSLSSAGVIYEGQKLMVRMASTPTVTPTITATPRPPTRTPIPAQTVQPAQPNEPSQAAENFLGGLSRQTFGLILVAICGLGLALIIFSSMRKQK